MKFIIDANLPRRLSKWLSEKGFDSVHTLDFPEKNRTRDFLILDISMQEKRVVITKDKDFLNSFLLERRPYKLILVTAGNLPNNELFLLFEKYFSIIEEKLLTDSFIELDRNSIISHI